MSNSLIRRATGTPSYLPMDSGLQAAHRSQQLVSRDVGLALCVHLPQPRLQKLALLVQARRA